VFISSVSDKMLLDATAFLTFTETCAKHCTELILLKKLSKLECRGKSLSS